MAKYSEDMIIKARPKYLKEYYKLKEGKSRFDTVKELSLIKEDTTARRYFRLRDGYLLLLTLLWQLPENH